MKLFDSIADSIIRSLTYFIHEFGGVLQVTVYLVLAAIFCFAMIKCYKAFRTLASCSLENLGEKELLSGHGPGSPLSVVTASFFMKTKRHYLENESANPVPPDAYIADAAFQYGERHFAEKFLEPISMTANLLPPLGFIGTIFGMTIHFIHNDAAINSSATVAGIATALYTTLLALIAYTVIEFFKKILYLLSQKRVDEGLAFCASHLEDCEFDNIEYIEKIHRKTGG